MFSKEQGFFWRPLECLVCRRMDPGMPHTEAGSAEGSRDGGPGLLAVPLSLGGLHLPFLRPSGGSSLLFLSVKGEADCHLSLMKGDKDTLSGAFREIPPTVWLNQEWRGVLEPPPLPQPSLGPAQLRSVCSGPGLCWAPGRALWTTHGPCP